MANQPKPRQPNEDGPSEAKLELADELLQRTRDFLEKCVEDPKLAFAAEDPDALSDKLHRLTHAPVLEDESGGPRKPEPPTEHRRSA